VSLSADFADLPPALGPTADPRDDFRPLSRLARLRQLPLVSILIVVILVGGAIFAPLLAPDSPLKIDLSRASQPPFFLSGGSTSHLLGTDNLGRDILSRVLYGGRVTLVLATLVMILGAIVGVALGLASGYLGGVVDAVVQRLVEAILSLPTIMVALVFAFVLGQSFVTVVVILAPFIAARFARMIRGDVLSIRSQGFVELAQVAGASPFRIIRKHILPNVIGTVIVVGTLEIGQLILLEASLSFLGVGVPPPTPEWGLMVSQGEQFLATKWWISLFPGLAIVAAVLAINLIGDWLRDYLDPKRGERS
jgi:peptide/nickel transport system permease protein